MDSSIPRRVDQLLLEQGEYHPLEYLLLDGRLMYSDYEAWRGGECERLDELLFGDLEEIATELTEAASYAQALGLAPSRISYTPWGGEGTLVTSRNAALAVRLEQVYEKPGDRPQMDLFMDSAGTSLANGVVLALGRRDVEEAGRCLEKLYQADPGNARLGGLERLVDAAREQDAPLQDPVAELARLEQELLPLAEELLGAAGRHFMNPLWRRLHAGLRGQTFDSEQPGLHPSHTAMRMLDWGEAIAAVESEVGWRQQPILLRRHLLASERLHRPAEATMDLFDLCWRFPEEVAPLLRQGVLNMANPRDLFDELDPALELSAFPAWLLIIRPGMLNWMPRPEASQPESYRLVYALQAARAGSAGLEGDVVRQRAELKALDPVLFRHFIRNL